METWQTRNRGDSACVLAALIKSSEAVPTDARLSLARLIATIFEDRRSQRDATCQRGANLGGRGMPISGCRQIGQPPLFLLRAGLNFHLVGRALIPEQYIRRGGTAYGADLESIPCRIAVFY